MHTGEPRVHDSKKLISVVALCRVQTRVWHGVNPGGSRVTLHTSKYKMHDFLKISLTGALLSFFMHSRAMVDINLSFEIQMVIVIKLLMRKNRKSSIYQDLSAMHDLLNFYDNFNKLLN